MTYSQSDLLKPFLGMYIAAVVAVYTLFWRPRSRESTLARPKDASPSDFDTSQERRGYRG